MNGNNICHRIALGIHVFFTHYMMWFPEEDKGVPPGCRHPLCPLDHNNRITNTNKYVKVIGDIGYKYFDRERKFYQGLASFVTLMAMGITMYGCCALSTDFDVVQRTYWAAGTGQNTTSGDNFAMYIGLRSLVYVNCRFVPGYNNYGSNCYQEMVSWNAAGCNSQQSPLNPVDWIPTTSVFQSNHPVMADACQSCSNTAVSLWITAVMSCVSLVLAFLGAQTRMRSVADVPVQKLLGMGADGWGAITLAYALYTFRNSCFYGIMTNMSQFPDLKVEFWMGPGWGCYVICCLAGFIRAIVHVLTPLPGKGSECSWCNNGEPATEVKSLQPQVNIVLRPFSEGSSRSLVV